MRYFSLIFSFLVCSLLTGCFGDPEFSNVPAISYRSISISEPRFGGANQDSIVVSIDFQDGDGDLGLSGGDTTGIYADKVFDPNVGDSIINPFSLNFYVTLIKRTNTEFDTVFFPVAETADDPEPLSGRYPRIGDGTGAIEGILNFSFIAFYGNAFGNILEVGDTVFAQVEIVDRALNVSNSILTEEVVIGSLD